MEKERDLRKSRLKYLSSALFFIILFLFSPYINNKLNSLIFESFSIETVSCVTKKEAEEFWNSVDVRESGWHVEPWWAFESCYGNESLGIRIRSSYINIFLRVFTVFLPLVGLMIVGLEYNNFQKRNNTKKKT